MTKSEQLKPKKREKKLSRKDLLFVEKVVEDGNISKAVREVYDVQDPKYAFVKGNRLMENDSIANAVEVKRMSLKEALIEQGINEKKIALKVDELLDSEDPNAIDKGLKHATNIYGVVEASKSEGGNTYNFLFSPETQADIKLLEDKIKARLLNKND